MSELKITGSVTPVVGKEEFYSVNQVLPSLFPFQNSNSAATNNFEQPVEWSLHILENGRWIKKEANNKKGNKIFYKFSQLSLERKGIRILAKRGEQTAKLDVKTRNAEKPKIDSIELLDKSGNKPSAPLSYGQTLKARVHCLHMERRKIYVTLWEDDAKGAGHNKTNEKNIIKTLPGIVKNGIADVDFLLSPSAAKIATKGDPDEGKIHEYYVTTDFDSKKIASNNLNVKELETPVATYRARTATPRAPQHTVVRAAPTRTAPVAVNTTTTAPKGKITNVHITDTENRAISGTYNKKGINVWIHSTGLIEKEINLKLYEHDNVGNDPLVDQNFVIKKNIHGIYVDLSKIPRSWGGNILEEGVEQELFAEVEVLQTHQTKKSAIVDVKANVFKQDGNDLVNTVTKIFEPSPAEKKDEDEGECPNCDKNITLDDIKRICVSDKGKCLIEDLSMITAALPYLNKYRKKVGINTCIRKAHFLAQISQESKFYSLQENLNWYWESLIGTFSSYFDQFITKEAKEAEAKRLGRANISKTPGLTIDQQIKLANAIYGKTHKNGSLHLNSGDGWLYSGKGFKQITWKSNYIELEKYFNSEMKIDGEADINWTDGDNPSKLKNNAKDAIVSALAFWGKNNINTFANENSAKSVEKVTKKINPALKGLEERKGYFNKAVNVLKVNDCIKGSEVGTEEGTVILVSGKDTKKERDPAQNIYWVMYKTTVYKNMSLEKFKKLKASKKLPDPDFTTYLSRDTHQTYSKKLGSLKHSDKRYGQYNEIPPGEYFLVPGVAGQTYKIYVIDSESKGASAANGIDGVDGARGGVALHHYCPRFSVGCFTFNSGTDTAPVTRFINEIPDLKLKDDRPVRFIVEERKVVESTWNDSNKGTKKWIGI